MTFSDVASVPDRDGLRLFGLSRIPRCSSCRRFEALKQTHLNGSDLAEPLPPVPSGCSHQHCRPLITRLTEAIRVRSPHPG